MDDIMQRIRSSYTALPNAKKTVASFFLNHFEQLQFLTVTELAEKVGVACVPGTSFFMEDVNNIVRVHFAKKDDTLNEALNRLADIRKKMG